MKDMYYFMVTFTDQRGMYFVALPEDLQDPTMADTCIPCDVDDVRVGITCYITNKMNWEPAIMEMMILKQFFEENGKKFLQEHGYKDESQTEKE